MSQSQGSIERVVAIHWTWAGHRRVERPRSTAWLVALACPPPGDDPLAALRGVARRVKHRGRPPTTWEEALFGSREDELAEAGLRRLHGMAVRAELELTLRADEPFDAEAS